MAYIIIQSYTPILLTSLHLEAKAHTVELISTVGYRPLMDKKPSHTVRAVQETIMVEKIVSTLWVFVLVATYTVAATLLCVQSINQGSLLGTVFFAFIAVFSGYMSVALPVLHWQTYK